MKVRRIIDDMSGTTRQRRIVWFGSYGTNTDGTSKLVNDNDKHDNFASENQMIHDSLIQRLSVIQHELWYDYQYGMPLVEDDVSKLTIDNFVLQTVQEHEGVTDITSFSSYLDKHNYHCEIKFDTIFGSNNISI